MSVRPVPDHSHAAFVSDYGANTLQSDLINAVKKWLECKYGKSYKFVLDSKKWEHVTGDKRDYRSEFYQDDKDRPRIKVVVHSHKTNENITFDDYAEVFEPTYRAWLEEQRELTAVEKAEFARRREERKLDAEKKAAERELKQRCDAEKAAQDEAERKEHIRAAIESHGKLPTTGRSPYLERKLGDSDVSGTRFRGTIAEYAFVDPLTQQIVGLQRIMANGKKLTVKGSTLKGAGVFLNGLPPKNHEGKIRIGESVTTTETARRAWNDSARYVASSSASNLCRVAAQLERRCPKATIELILDNDWQKAREFDEHGKPKPNTGLEMGHRLAMRRGYQVYQPDFGDLENVPGLGTLSDFNDLYKAGGMDEVRRQLVPRGADPDWAFKGLRAKERGRLRGLFCHHDLTVVNQQHLDPSWIIKGRDNAAHSSHGTGKTYGLKSFFAENPDLSVLYISPLSALAVENASKFKDVGFVSYQDTKDDSQLRRAKRLTITPDSLIRLTSEGAALPYYEAVVIDEPSYTLERLLSKIRYKKIVFDTLRCVLQRAETTVWLDADLNTPTVNLWAQWLPESRFNVALNEYMTGTGRTFTIVKEQADLQNLALEMLGNGRKVCYNTNTKKPGRAAQLLIQKQQPDLKTLYVSADNGGDDDVEGFFKDVAGTVADLDCLIYTPKISTGVSIDQPHNFEAVFSEISTNVDVGTPNGAIQQAERARDVAQKYAWVEGTTSRTYLTDPDEIAARWLESHEYDADLLGLTPEGKRGLSDPVYEGIARDVTLVNNYAKRHYRWEFLKQLYLRGYQIEFAEAQADGAEADETDDLIAVRRSLEQTAHETEVTANDFNDGLKAKELARKQNRTGEETAELTAYQVRQTFALDDGENVTTEQVKQFKRGALLREVRRLEIATADQATLRLLSERQHEEGELYARDMRLYGVEGAVGRWVLEALHITPETLEVHDETPLRADSETIVQLVEKLIKHRKAIRGAGINLPEADKLRATPMTTVGSLLRRVNLKTRSTGRNQPNRPRVIDPDGLTYMRELVMRRREKAEKLAQLANETGEAYIKEKTPPVSSPPVSTIPKPVVIVAQNPPKKAVVQSLETTELVTITAYTGDYARLKHVLTTGPLQDDRYFNGLRVSCEQAVQGNLPAQWHVDATLRQPEVQRRLGLT